MVPQYSWCVVLVSMTIPVFSASSLPLCTDQWKSNPSESIAVTDPCKLQRKIGSSVDMYCNVNTSEFYSVSWSHKLRGSWIPVLPDINSGLPQLVLLSNGNLTLTLLSTYVSNDDTLYYHNNNTNGTYRCAAVSKTTGHRSVQIIELELYECAERNYDLNFVHVTSSEALADAGSKVMTTCIADYTCRSSGPYSAVWYLNVGSVSPTRIEDLNSSNYKVNTSQSNAGRYVETSLTIQYVHEEDFTNHFVCVVLNSTESVNRSFHVKQVDVITKHLPFPILIVLLAVLLLVFAALVIFTVTCHRRQIGTYVKSRLDISQNEAHNDKLFILHDCEEEKNENGVCIDEELACKVEEMFQEFYNVGKSADTPPGRPQEQAIEGYDNSTTNVIIMPDTTNIERFKEIDSLVSRRYRGPDVNYRYLTVIDRPMEEMRMIPSELKGTYLLSKELVHLPRPEQDATEKDKTKFYENLKERVASLPTLAHGKETLNFRTERSACCCFLPCRLNYFQMADRNDGDEV